MEDNILDGKRYWVCHPDEGGSHITEYSQSVGGCQIHQIAGGCTIPPKSLEAIIEQQVLIGQIELANLYGTPRCENLHHSKKNRHSALEECPVVRQISKLTGEKK